MHVGGGPDIRGGETHAYWIVIEILYNVIYSGCGRRERDGRVWPVGKPVWQAQHPTEAPDSSPRAVPLPASGNLQDRHGQVSLKHTHTHNFIIKEDKGGVYHLCWVLSNSERLDPLSYMCGSVSVPYSAASQVCQ